MNITAIDDTYVMGRTAGEARRLQVQADLLQEPTRRLLVNSGIGPGMRVLDLGSGAGDVALLVAELVGQTGAVVGVDTNDAILATARQRADEAGYSNVCFIAGDLRALELDGEFDAITGRLIFLHLTDPTIVLRGLLPQLRPDGVVAICEPDLRSHYWQNSYPVCPLYQHACAWVADAVKSGGVNLDIALNLHHIFVDAGLEAPSMQAHALVSGRDVLMQRVCDWITATTQSLLSVILREGIATEDEIGIDTLAQRMAAEALAAKAVLRFPSTVGAWARKPVV